MERPPAVMVHGLNDALLVLRTGLPATLLSAPGAGVYAGVGWWRALVAAACQEAGVSVADILDCGAAPGRALEALRGGQLALVLAAPAELWTDVAGRARELGAELLAAPPPALDLRVPGAARGLADYLRRT